MNEYFEQIASVLETVVKDFKISKELVVRRINMPSPRKTVYPWKLNKRGDAWIVQSIVKTAKSTTTNI
jgi:hypothetical protein